jgi:hypothetical protein
MNEQGGWDEFVVALCDLAVTYDADAFLHESLVLLTARAIPPGDKAGRIAVTRFDDEAARIETGWCFNIVTDYVAEDASQPVPALRLVEAICRGDAEEHCLIDEGGRWVGVLLNAWGEGGNWMSGDHDRPERRATRRFPRWSDAH